MTRRGRFRFQVPAPGHSDTALLYGVRIVDLSQLLPGPYATQLMATLGADVVKVEPPCGDPLRSLLCPADSRVSPLYEAVNAGKKIVFLDLKTSTGTDDFENLLASADVLLDCFRPGVLDQLGFSEQKLEELNSRLVYCSLSGYGQTGPYRSRAGHDINYCAMAGLYSWGNSGESPEIPFPLIADHVGALQAVNTIVAALFRRERTGKGCRLDVSLYETLLSWQYTEQLSGMRNMLNGGAAYFNIYPTADDRLLSLGALEEKFWERFCKALAKPEWINRYHDPIPQKDLITDVGAILRTKNQYQWIKRFDDVDCCMEAVPPMDELLQQPQVQYRGLVDGKAIRFPALVDGEVTPLLPGFRELESGKTSYWEE